MAAACSCRAAIVLPAMLAATHETERKIKIETGIKIEMGIDTI